MRHWFLVVIRSVATRTADLKQMGRRLEQRVGTSWPGGLSTSRVEAIFGLLVVNESRVFEVNTLLADSDSSGWRCILTPLRDFEMERENDSRL